MTAIPSARSLRTKLALVLPAAAGLFASAAWAQAPDTKAAPAPAAVAAPAGAAAVDDAPLAPFLDESTFIVARLDVDRVDHDAMAAFMEKFIETVMKTQPIPPDVRPQVQAEAMKTIGSAKTWLTNMSEAGGKHVYLLFNQDETLQGPPGMVVPVAEGGDIERVESLMSAGLPQIENLQQVGRAVVYAQPQAMERAKARLTPAGAARVERPELTKAFAAGGAGDDAPVRVALVPGESSRKWVEENLPKLPDVLGGGETKLISRGIKWASLTLAQKPATLAHVTLKAENAEQAKALLDLVKKGLEAAGPILAALPQSDEAAAKAGEIKPTLAGDTISMTIDPVLLQFAIVGLTTQGARVEAEVDVDAKEPKPAKPDDGGL